MWIKIKMGVFIEPSRERYEQYKKIANGIDRKLAKIEKDTRFYSGSKPTLNHPKFKALVQQGDRIVPYLFHIITHRGASWTIIFLLLRLLPDTNPIKNEHRGDFYAIIHDLLGWYLNSPYRDIDNIYQGLVD